MMNELISILLQTKNKGGGEKVVSRLVVGVRLSLPFERITLGKSERDSYREVLSLLLRPKDL
jgi:hypothetical protein